MNLNTISLMLNVQKVNDKSHLVRHAIEKCHKYHKIEDFNIFGKVIEITPLNGK